MSEQTTTESKHGAGAGLVLGDRIARLVMLRTGPDGKPQANQWTEPLPQGAVADGRIRDAEAVRAALEVLARRADPMLFTVQTWLGIHPASSVVQTLDLAGLSPVDAERRLGELAADLGEGMVGGWEIRQRAGRVRALVVAAPRVEVVKASELAEAAGFRVAGMELLPVALVRAVARDNQPAGFAVYGLGQGGGRCAVAWRSGSPVLGGRLWPPAAGDAGLSVYGVPPADLDLLARQGAGFALGSMGFPVDVGLDLDPGLGLERLLATLGADLPQGPEVDAPALGLALVASGRVDAPVDLLAASGSKTPPPGTTLIDLRPPGSPPVGVIDLTDTPSSTAPGAGGDSLGSAPLAAVGLGVAGAVQPVDPLIDGAVPPTSVASADRRAAVTLPNRVQFDMAPIGKAGSVQRRNSHRPIGWVGLFGAGAGTLLFGGLAAFAVSRSGGEESASDGPEPVIRPGTVVGTAVLQPSGSTVAGGESPSPRPTSGVTTTSTVGATDPASVSTPASSATGSSAGSAPTTPVPPATSAPATSAPATSTPASTPPAAETGSTTLATTPATTSSTTSAASAATTGTVVVAPATSTTGTTGTTADPRAKTPATPSGVSASTAERWAATIAIPVDRSVTTAQTAVLAEGKLTISGAVASVPEGQEVLARGAEFVGPDKVVVGLVVNPAAPVSAPAPAIVVEDNVLFAFGAAEVLPEYTSLLDLQARALVAQPDATITVGAHTDSIGSEEYNHALSLERANAVRDYLLAKGVSPSQIVVEAKGESEPIADNATPEGRQLNRRVCTELAGLLDG